MERQHEHKSRPMRPFFLRFSNSVAKLSGQPGTFVTATALVAVWAVTGPMFHYSQDWQLVINTGTTIITFLMVFLIQNTQNRDSHAVHLKLDELIRATQGAHTELLDIEELTETQLEELRCLYEKLARHARQGRKGAPGDDCPDITLPLLD